MPSVFVPNIGEVEYVPTRLPEGIKGKATVGVLTEPILITEDLGPGTKLEYVVAHEVGHRLTLDMIENAYKESPSSFELCGSPVQCFISYLKSLGLKEQDVKPIHHGTARHLHEIFSEPVSDDIGLEFIAEVYANWATDRGSIPDPIAKRFRLLTQSKNIILGKKAAFDGSADITVNEPMRQRAIREMAGARSSEWSAAVYGAVAVLVIYLVLK